VTANATDETAQAVAFEAQMEQERQAKAAGATPTTEDPAGLADVAIAAAGAAPDAAMSATSTNNVESKDINLDVILDVTVTLSMEAGRTRLPIRNLLQLNQGSVVELERAAGEPLDVYVNGTLIAHGEVVVVNEKFGLRLTDVVSPAERIRRLR
jgi:flagellar motor switch protein FliN/FliY